MTNQFDFLIIGSGIAGLSYALKVSDVGRVAIITKKQDTESNTNYAQGGIAAVVSPEDSFEEHIQDTLKAGDGLAKREIVQKVVEAGPKCIQELIDLGVRFSMKNSKEFDLGKEGGHSKNRVVHMADTTGKELERVLLENVKKKRNIKIYENHLAIDLLTQHQLKDRSQQKSEKIKCWGAYVLNVDTNEVDKYLAKITVVATGGAGRIYLYTTNPEIATGDGVAMAYRAGAEIANMEFFQFHPTALYHPQGRNFLISETVRGEGGKLRLKSGVTFMEKYHPLKELAPRDVVARAIDSELKKTGDPCVYLDITFLDKDFIKNRFPNIYNFCLPLGLDITKDWIPVVPSAHYTCGGILTDSQGKTAIENLYACGEVTCTGLHGANRLASNSLLEGLAFADFCAQSSKTLSPKLKRETFPEFFDWSTEGVFDQKEWVVLAHDKEELQKIMWDYVGIVRSNSRLNKALKRIEILKEEIESFYKVNPVRYDLVQLRNMVTVAELLVLSALQRKESRGLHYTLDYSEKDDKNFLKDTILKKGLP